MFEIEKGIPIPDARARGREKSRSCALLVEKMEVGDSVLVSNTHRQQLHAMSNTLGIKYKTRTICKESNTVRFWRTK